MTCIVGLIDDDKTYIGGDSISYGGYSKSFQKTPKVFKNKDFIFGYTSSFRFGQILQYRFKIPNINKTQSLDDYLITNFIPEMMKILKDDGYTTIENNVEKGGICLLGHKNRLFKIQSDFSILESTRNYTATGCGEDYALGSLYTSTNKNPETRITKAIETASEFCGAVGGPITIIHT